MNGATRFNHRVVGDVPQPFGRNSECRYILVEMVILVVYLVLNQINVLTVADVEVRAGIPLCIFPFECRDTVERNFWEKKGQKSP